MSGIDEALATRGTGNVLSDLQCSRCWTKYRRKRSKNITLVEGSAFCLDCVDERIQAQKEHDEAMREFYAACFDNDSMTIAEVWQWIKVNVFRRPG